LHKNLIKKFNTIVYFRELNNNKFYIYFALFALDFKDFIYIFISIVNANASAFAIFILKFVNIVLKEDEKTNFIFIFKIFYL